MTGLGHLSGLSDDDLLRAAIRYEYEHFPDTADFALGQLYSGTVQGDPAAERVWAEETAPEQVELDLHLEAPGCGAMPPARTNSQPSSPESTTPPKRSFERDFN